MVNNALATPYGVIYQNKCPAIPPGIAVIAQVSGGTWTCPGPLKYGPYG